ncbi:Os03g0140300, partial [Oryza sativa Japonica Group]
NSILITLNKHVSSQFSGVHHWLSSLDPYQEPILHVEYDGQPRLHDVPRHHLHGKVPRHGRRRDLHLHERHLLAEACPRPGVERDELVRRHVPQLAVLGDPPLRPELPAVLAPHPLHPPHGVVEHQHLVAGHHLVPAGEHVVGDRRLVLQRHRRVQPHGLAKGRVQVQEVPHLARVERHHAAVAGEEPPLLQLRLAGSDGRQLLQELLLDARVRGEEVEEPRQRRARGVAAGDEEVHRHVPDVHVGVGAAGDLVVAEEGGKQVGDRLLVAASAAALSGLALVIGSVFRDGRRDEALDRPPRRGVPLLVPNP